MSDKALSSLTSIGTLADADTGDEVYIVRGGNSRRAALGSGWVLAADLASTDAGKGADLVGLPDPTGYFVATTVRSALEELRTDHSIYESGNPVPGAKLFIEPGSGSTDPLYPNLATLKYDAGQHVFETWDYVSDVQRTQLRIQCDSLAVNNLVIQPAQSTHAPTEFAEGSDTNISLHRNAKGTGAHLFSNGEGFLARFTGDGSGNGNVHHVELRAAQSSGYPLIAPHSTSSSNVDIGISGLGTGFIIAGSDIEVADSRNILDDSGNEILKFGKTATALNYVKITNAATGTGPSIRAEGSETDVPLNLDAKGSSQIVALDHLCASASTINLGRATLPWGVVYLDTAKYIDWGNNNARITHSTGLLTCSVDFVVPADAFGSAWNGSNEVPTKNDIFDAFLDSTWTPVLTGVANIDAVTHVSAYYSRSGSVVHVFGESNVNPTAAAPTLTQFRISLPIASNFTATSEASGVIVRGTATGAYGMIASDAASDELLISFMANDVVNAAYKWHASFKVL